MCLRDKPWLFTSTSPFAAPQLSFVDMTRSATPGVFLDSLAHDDFRLPARVALGCIKEVDTAVVGLLHD